LKTTSNLGDEVVRMAKVMARKGLMAGKRYERTKVDDLPVFQVREDSPVFTLEDVKRDEDGW
jgi:hypothetical protein